MGYNNRMPDGYYMRKQKQEQDPYHGMYTKKQLADLEGETELKRTSINKKVLTEKVRKQKGAGLTFVDPIGFVKDIKNPIQY